MTKTRLEAFSDGVLAIVITIMVLELKEPGGAELKDLSHSLPTLFSYLLGFIYVGIYWNNHHHLMQAVKSVNGRVLWANMHLLFWLSLFPFMTAWVNAEGLNHRGPVIAYGMVLLMAGVAYWILTHALICHHGRGSVLHEAIGDDVKGRVSLLIYAVGIGASVWQPIVGIALYIGVALMWLVPDRRLERALHDATGKD
ncbi:MAG: DUF1211 domain-containing protein [Chthonomonas sp.]|nr:DUF1211 domain-containing protein [Chthonomonas sp.]